MKSSDKISTVTFIVLLQIILSASCYSQTGWTLRSTGFNINSVFFISSSKGWIVGDSGLAFATYDGGSNWSGLDSKTKSNLKSVYFRDPYNGYACGDGGTVIKTTNGGDIWILLTTGVTYNLRSVYFANADTGYAIGEKELRTTNGGVTWTDYVLVLSASGAAFINSTTGFHVNSSNIFKTTNGGSSWYTTILTGSYSSIFFINSSTGWTSGTGGSVRYTTNTGSNWSLQTTSSGFSTLYGLHFSDVNSGWTAGSPGTVGGNSEIRRTTNAGSNWSAQSSGTPSILRSVYSTSADNGLIVGDAGTILKTSNAGTNWNGMLNTFSYPTTPFYNLNTMYFINNNTGWTGSYYGIVNKTTDAGESWSSVLTSSYNTILSSDFVDTDTGWVCGEGGMVQITKNAGANWTSLPTGVSASLNCINIEKLPVTGYFGLYNVGWCVGNSGTIMRTTNGGGNWAVQTSGSTINYYSVIPFSEDVALICGDSGRILKTTNGGESWDMKVSGIVDGALRSFAFADENNGICAGDSASVLVTSDKGETWISVTGDTRSLTTKNLYSASARIIGMISYTIVGDDGTILASDDDGMSWTKLSSGVKTRLTGISSPADFKSFVAGYRGTVLKTTDGGVLPVELNSFTSLVNGSNVILRWQTSSEINNKGFEIQRSIGDNWSVEGFVNGQGNTGNISDYLFEDTDLKPGKYIYRLKQIDFNGSYKFYDLTSDVIISVPGEFTLSQNFPNPFNPVTSIRYSIPVKTFVKIRIYDVSGREIETLVNEILEAGNFVTKFDASAFSSGVYFYRIDSGEFTQTRKMILLK